MRDFRVLTPCGFFNRFSDHNFNLLSCKKIKNVKKKKMEGGFAPLRCFHSFFNGGFMTNLSNLEKQNLIYLFKICELKFDLHPITNLFKTVQQKEVWQPKY